MSNLNPWHDNCYRVNIPKMSDLILFVGHKKKKKSPVLENSTVWADFGHTSHLWQYVPFEKVGSSRINVIFPLFENQHFIYLRPSMVITAWIYSNLMEMSVVVPPNP
jgi:hypothetical protein